ncbi:MAG: hypothetical protein ABJ275_04630 [Maricaulaceae bacterium]
MFKSKLSLVAVTVSSICLLAVSPASFANGFNSYGGSSSSHGFNQSYSPSISSSTGGLTSGVFEKKGRNISSTASFYYRVGVNNFKKGHMEKAERAFKAVLRADGLDTQANFYLAKIKLQEGDESKALEYAKAYHSVK